MNRVAQVTHPTAAGRLPSLAPASPSGRVYLLPGELHVAQEPCEISTILGSCVAICVWDPVEGVGGMNHFLLPAARSEEGASARFGDVAWRLLLQQVLARGCRREDLVVKLFGGAAMFQADQPYPTTLGGKNVLAARKLIARDDLRIAREDVGGLRGRKLIFNTRDGSARTKQI